MASWTWLFLSMANRKAERPHLAVSRPLAAKLLRGFC
jgi:hypothetical protein